MSDWKERIEAAAERTQGYLVRTPTLSIGAFDLQRPVELKFEQMQHTGSFKPRGAFNTLLSTPAVGAGVVAASGGNHGAAVAYAAASLGIPARIFVPELAGPAKIALIKRTGADLEVVPGAYADALDAAKRYEEKTGALQIHAYDAGPTIAGQGTLMREWEEQGLDADTVLIAVGGGGLLAGALGWLEGRRKVVAVEPELAPTLHRALANGPETEVEVSGIAANALGARKIGYLCYQLARYHDVQSVLVSDAAIAEAQLFLWRGLHQLVEPAGAAALAALASRAYVPEPDERVAVLVCGANVAPDPFPD